MRLMSALMTVFVLVATEASAAPTAQDLVLDTLEASAEAGDVEAQFRLSRAYRNFHTADGDEAALAWLSKAATGGHPMAQTMLADAYENGLGVMRDTGEALRWYRQAANAGFAEAQYRLASYLMTAGGEGDKEEAADWMRQAAQQGLATAAYSYAVFLTRGQGLAKDADAALPWAVQACAEFCVRDDTTATETVLLMTQILIAGNGKAEDRLKGAGLLVAAADKGNATAQMFTGKLLEDGIALAKDEAAAARRYKQAVEAGHRDAHYALGKMTLDGRGIAKNAEAAVRLFREGSERDDTNAMNALAHCYEDGRGIGKDIMQAYLWYSVAASRTPPEEPSKAPFIADRDKLKNRLSAAQLKEGEELIKMYREKYIRDRMHQRGKVPRR